MGQPFDHKPMQNEVERTFRDANEVGTNTPQLTNLEKMDKISEVLKDSGADSASQLKSLSKIKNILGW